MEADAEANEELMEVRFRRCKAEAEEEIERRVAEGKKEEASKSTECLKEVESMKASNPNPNPNPN